MVWRNLRWHQMALKIAAVSVKRIHGTNPEFREVGKNHRSLKLVPAIGRGIYMLVPSRVALS